jgi:pimeloyl-ACP methyl ester carboxylesterase
MSRLSPLLLTLRRDPRYGELSDAILIERGSLHRGLGRTVILVHGFNNSRRDAKRSFESFTRHLPPLPVKDQLSYLFWPSDFQQREWSSYGLAVERAKECGPRLANFIEGLDSNSIVLIGHSLGSRVILEALRVAPSRVRQRVSVYLLAAAVPTTFLHAGARLEAGVTDAAAKVAFFSSRDCILRWTFPVGQARAHEGWRTEAVGLRGHPIGLWKPGFPDAGLDHSGYWSSHGIANAVARGMQLRAPPFRTRHLSTRTVPHCVRVLARRVIPHRG